MHDKNASMRAHHFQKFSTYTTLRYKSYKIAPTDFVTELNCRQAIARKVMNEKAWAYYSSAADDEITIRENHAAYHRYVSHFVPTEFRERRGRRIWFRPRILRNVTTVDWSTSILGHATSMPLYIVSIFRGKV